MIRFFGGLSPVARILEGHGETGPLSQAPQNLPTCAVIGGKAQAAGHVGGYSTRFQDERRNLPSPAPGLRGDVGHLCEHVADGDEACPFDIQRRDDGMFVEIICGSRVEVVDHCPPPVHPSRANEAKLSRPGCSCWPRRPAMSCTTIFPDTPILCYSSMIDAWH